MSISSALTQHNTYPNPVGTALSVRMFPPKYFVTDRDGFI